MIVPEDFCELLKDNSLSFFAGVPDSLLKNLCAHIDERYDANQHVITANEGNAIAMAMGHYLATGHPAVAYMQNSGLGNAVNPLTSMASEAVCSIPMLLIVGWRGEPGVADEPQHIKQGDITPQMLTLMDIPYVVLDANSNPYSLCKPLLDTMKTQSRPVAILVRKNTFTATAKSIKAVSDRMSREAALQVISTQLSDKDLVIATTGKTAREICEIQVRETGECSAFLTVGAMGHASSIAASIALAKPQKRVLCLDGDGALLMHMGAMAVIGGLKLENLVHVVLNNQAHESVGGQPTSISVVDVESLALANGYRSYIRIESESELFSGWKQVVSSKGPCFVEISIDIGSRKDLGRPESAPRDNARTFLNHAK